MYLAPRYGVSVGMHLAGRAPLGRMCVEAFRFSIWVFGKKVLIPHRGPPQKTEVQDYGSRATDPGHWSPTSVKDLTLTSEGYQKIHDRFLEVYRRDILDNVDRQGRKKISEGNGDAVTDASLYTSGRRFDERVLVDL